MSDSREFRRARREAFVQLLTRLMGSAGLSQTEIADAIGMKRQHVGEALSVDDTAGLHMCDLQVLVTLLGRDAGRELLESLVAPFGYRLVPDDEAAPSITDVLAAEAEVLGATSVAVADANSALADGVVTTAECAAIKADCARGHRALSQLEASAEAAVIKRPQ